MNQRRYLLFVLLALLPAGVLVIVLSSSKQPSTKTGNNVISSSIKRSGPESPSGTNSPHISRPDGVTAGLIDDFKTAKTPPARKALFAKLLSLISNEQACELVENFPIGDEYDWGLTQVVEKFLNSDPEYAKKWLRELPAEAANSRAFASFGRIYAEANAAEAFRFGTELKDPVKRMKYLSQAIRVHGADDPAAAKAWIDQNENMFLSKELAYADLLQSAPIEFVLKNIDIMVTESEKNAILTGILNKPAVPPSNSSQQNIEPKLAAFNQLLNSDPIAASEYLNKIPQTEERDSYVSHLAAAIQNRQPKEAFTWALSISDPEKRFAACQQIASLQTGEDLGPLIQSARLSEEQKAALLKLHN